MTGLLDHLDRQLVSSRRMLQIVLAQGEAIRRQDVEAVRQALQSVSVAHREVLVLCEFRGLNYLDASEILGVPMGTLQSRLNRARTALRHALGRQGVSA